MNSKEIILNAASLKKTERIPVSLLSGGVWTFNRRGYSLEQALNLGAEKNAQILEETNEEIGCDIVWPGSGYHNLAIRAIGGKIKFRAKGAPDIQETLLKDISDIENIDLSLIKKDKDINTLWDTTSILAKRIGSDTLVGASIWGPFTLAGHVYGVEKLMRNIYKNKDEVHKVLEFTSELCYEYLAPYADAGAGILSVADPTASGDMISRNQFKEFVVPYLKKVVAKLKKKGVISLIHICGNTTNRLDLIPEIGTDIISIDYKVPLSKAGEILKSKMAFSGNMNPVAVMQNLSADEVAEACKTCIKEAGSESSYILMPGCDIPPGVPVENIKAMVKTAHEFKNITER
ncbi:MAG: uroporphyrinogen decarboxylase family protein [Bacillota bacterium]|nr:uroporphyrinogen decarboxylase family protein [Bacillota bacterium]